MSTRLNARLYLRLDARWSRRGTDVAHAGADTFVSGSAIFKTKDYFAVLKSFKEKIKSPVISKELKV